jgi:hypothetical protein
MKEDVTVNIPRGTPENRPNGDTSKPANRKEAGQQLLYPTGAKPAIENFAFLSTGDVY